MMRFLSFQFGMMALLAISPAWAMAQQPDSPTAPPPVADSSANPAVEASAQEDFEILNRGPIHEAFADQILEDPAPTKVIPQQPPEPINEIPPEVKPGDDAIWIPGYFAWSDIESDFIWVSGVWRVPPPGQRWTPGYWTEAEGGSQWVPGFWADAQAQSLNYLPYPPESLDNGPTSPSPGEDYYWVSGCWQWQSNQYTWQPGYWNVYRPGWTWIPQYYAWSPRGAIYCGGYWDYPFGRRGLLFAPVHYRSPIYRQPGYYYRPSYAIRPSNLLLHLFVNVGSRNLYFGDYYGSRYYDRGYRGWSHYHRHNSYLPSYVYYRHHFRNQGIDFGDRLDRWSRYYDRHPEYRPAHTVAESRRQAERFRDNDSFSRQSLFVSLINDLVNQNGSNRGSFHRIDDSDRGRIDRDRRELAELRRRREQVEDRREAPDRADRDGRVRPDGNRGDRPDRDRPTGDRPDGDRPTGERPDGERPDGERPDGDRPTGDRPTGERPDGDRPTGDRPDGDRPDGDRPTGERPDGDRPTGDRPTGDRPTGDRPDGDRPTGDRPTGDRPTGERPDGDRGQRPGASRPTLDLPNYLNDPDRRARFERQLRELRSRIPDRAGEGRPDPSDRNRPGRSDNDRGELPNRGNIDRGNIDRGNIDRGNPTRGDATPGNVNRGDNDGRGNPFNRDRDSNRSQPNLTPQRPVTPPTAQPRTERTPADANSLRDLIRERSRGESSPSRTVPTPQPRTEQPRIRTERPSFDSSRGRSFPSFDSNRSIRSPATSRPSSAAPDNSSRRPTAIPSARRPVPSASGPRAISPRSQPRVSQPQRSSQPRASQPQRSSRPSFSAPSRSRGDSSARGSRGSSRGGGSARSSRGGRSRND